MILSVAAACLAKIPANRVINFMPLPMLRQWVSQLL